MFKQDQIHSTNKISRFELKQHNLVPFYVIEDSLKSNFQSIQSFINMQQQTNNNLQKKINNINQTLLQINTKHTQKVLEMEKNIFNNIKTQIEGTVTVILNDQLANIFKKIVESQTKQVRKQQQFKATIRQLEKRIYYQITQENQKFFIKQISKIQKQINKKFQISSLNDKNSLLKSNSLFNKFDLKQLSDQKIQNNSEIISTKIDRILSKQYEKLQQSNQKQQFNQLKSQVQKLNDYRIEFDKKFTQNFESLKQNWKQLGLQLLDNKKILNKKIQQLSLDCIKLKNLSEFKPLTDNTDDNFKKKILEKFNQFYQIIATLNTKNEFQMVNQRTKNTLNRLNEEVSSLRNHFQKNTEYFTFYVNNSSTDDLKQAIVNIRQDILQNKKFADILFEQIKAKTTDNKNYIESLAQSLGAVQATQQNNQEKIQKIIANTDKLTEKIKALEDLNDIDPFKMKKIHDALDVDMNFPETVQPSLNQIKKLSSNQLKMIKELKRQTQLLKDQLFVLASQKNINGNQEDSLSQLKNEIKNLNKKFDKLKLQNEETQLSRKPWIVLNDKQKQHLKEPSLQRDGSKKKITLDIGKGGGFLTANRASDKVIQMNIMNSTPEEKFEVYEKYREKYLSDTLKLPEIFKEKLNFDDILR